MSAAPSIDPEKPFLKPLIERLKRHPKRIVFAEGDDPRVLEAAAQLVKLEAAAPILLGKRSDIRATAKKHGISTDLMMLINPEKSADFALFCDRFEQSEKLRGHVTTNACETVAHPDFFGALMVQYGQADGLLGGNQSLPHTLFRALTQMVKPLPGMDFLSSALVLSNPKLPHFGHEGVLFLADTSFIPEPTVEELARIAIETGKLAATLLGHKPKVAMLSFSTKQSFPDKSSLKMAAAAVLAREIADHDHMDIDIDGEVQADVALVPEMSEEKGRPNLIHGDADVLIFPDLNSGHIAAKLLEHVAGGNAYGRFVLGLSRPAAQVSRVASPQTVFGTAVALGVQAISYREIIAEEL